MGAAADAVAAADVSVAADAVDAAVPAFATDRKHTQNTDQGSFIAFASLTDTEWANCATIYWQRIQCLGCVKPPSFWLQILH